MNKELRSATEMLETNREELQSINEELTTVNQETKGNMDELAHANSDLQNLMASTSITTVFLDRRLAITRFTPSAAGLFNMIASDIGRPLEHLKYRLEYPELIQDAKQVLRTLVPIEREVRDGADWYLARIQPYRTMEDRIDGAVLTLVNVTERNRRAEALQLSEERMRLLIESAKDYAIFSIDREGRIDSWNAGAETMFGYTEDEIIGHTPEILFTPEDQTSGEPAREINRAKDSGLAEDQRWHSRKDGTRFFGSGSVMTIRDSKGELRGFTKILRDLTERQRAEEELTRFNNAAVGRENRMIELKKEVNDLCKLLKKSTRYNLAEEE